MSAMHVAASRTPLALPRPRVAGQAVLIAVIAGVTWLAMMGAVVSSYILGHPIDLTPKQPFVSYDLAEVVTTSYGSIAVVASDLSTHEGTLTAHFTLRQQNIRSTMVEAPQVEELRIVNAKGDRVSRPAALAWNGPAFVGAQATATIDVTLEAPTDAGPLWLEYENVRGQKPIHFALPGADR